MVKIDNIDLKKVYYIKKQTIVYKSSCFVFFCLQTIFLKIIYLNIKSRTTTVFVFFLSYINSGNIRHYCCYRCVFFIRNLLYFILCKYKNIVLLF